MGNDVYCVDIDNKKIENLKKGVLHIYEPGLEEIVTKELFRREAHFTTDIKEGLDDALFMFIAVGTPPDETESADLQRASPSRVKSEGRWRST